MANTVSIDEMAAIDTATSMQRKTCGRDAVWGFATDASSSSGVQAAGIIAALLLDRGAQAAVPITVGG